MAEEKRVDAFGYLKAEPRLDTNRGQRVVLSWSAQGHTRPDFECDVAEVAVLRLLRGFTVESFQLSVDSRLHLNTREFTAAGYLRQVRQKRKRTRSGTATSGV